MSCQFFWIIAINGLELLKQVRKHYLFLNPRTRQSSEESGALSLWCEAVEHKVLYCGGSSVLWRLRNPESESALLSCAHSEVGRRGRARCHGARREDTARGEQQPAPRQAGGWLAAAGGGGAAAA